MKTNVTGSFFKDLALIIIFNVALRMGASLLTAIGPNGKPVAPPTVGIDWAEYLTKK